MSDRSGRAEHLVGWRMRARSEADHQIHDGRVLWPSIGYDGKAIVFERDFKIWQLDTKNGEAYALPITLVGSAASPGISHLTLNQFTDLALSPDAKKIALIAHGEVFAASGPRRRPGDPRHPHAGPRIAGHLVARFDARRLPEPARRPHAHFLYDFPQHAETQLTNGALSDQGPRFSPDGKSIAFVRDRKELRVVDLDSKQERVLVTGFLGGGFGPAAFAWSPDSKWIVYADTGSRSLRNLYVVQAGGGAGRADQLPGELECELHPVESRRKVRAV